MELLGNDSNSFDSYKQAKFFSTKFLKNKFFNFSMFFTSLQANGNLYLSVMNELKELKSAGWKMESQNEIESVYKSMGIHVGIQAKF